MKLSYSSIALAISSALFSQTLFAQTDDELNSTDVSDVEVITVKGDFRSTNLQKSASAISLLTQDEINRRQAQNLEEIIALTPNVNYAGGSQRARYYQIRGIGERSQFQEPINPSVGIIVDGVDFTGIGSISSMFDVEQTEIFRGPQGTRFGANALAGVVNITTNAPSDSFEGSVKATVGNYGSQGLGAVVSGPATDTVNYRFAVEKYQSDGFIDNLYLDQNDTNNRDELSIRGKLAIEATKDLSIDVTLMHFDFDNGYDAFSLDNNRTTYSDEPGFDTQKTNALALTFNYQGFDTVNIKLITSLSDNDIGYGFDEDWSYGKYDDNTGECLPTSDCIEGGVWGYSTTDHYYRTKEVKTAELRFTSNNSSKLFNNTTDWVAGAYINTQEETLEREFFDWDAYATAVYSSAFDTETIAIYGQLDTKLSSSLILTTGLRVEERSAKYNNTNSVDTSPKETMIGGKIALAYSINDDSMVYASVNRGYKAGGINTHGSIDESAREFDKETLLNYEVGYKANYFDDAVYVRTSVFYMDRENIQLKDYTVVGVSFTSFIENATTGDNKGFEIEAGWQVTDNLDLYSSFGLLKTSFDAYENGKGEAVEAGEQAHAPDYQFALGGNYYITDNLFMAASVEAKDEFKFSDSHDERSESYYVMNASVNYQADDWSVSLWGRNITDQEYQVRGFYFGNDPRDGYTDKVYAQLGEPAVFGLTANYNF